MRGKDAPPYRQILEQLSTLFVGLIWINICLHEAEAQTTKPPRIGNRPVEGNGMYYYLDHIPERCQQPLITTLPGGGIIRGKYAFLKKDSPHIINGNIQIAPSGCLYIEPGTVLKFAPGVGMIINGTLIARVW